MMTYKTALALVLMTFISACGGSGGTAGEAGGKGPKDKTPEGCKSLYSVWRAPGSNEQWDFRAFEHSAVIADYGFISGNGSFCGYVNNPNHESRATLNPTPASWGYDYYLTVEGTLANSGGGIGTCAEHWVPSMTSYAYIEIRTQGLCNQIEVCGPTGNCKLLE